MPRKIPKSGELSIGVLLKGSLADAMIAESQKSLAAYAAITRAALVEYFSKRGYNVEDELQWGGPREARPKDEEPGESLAVVIG